MCVRLDSSVVATQFRLSFDLLLVLGRRHKNIANIQRPKHGKQSIVLLFLFLFIIIIFIIITISTTTNIDVFLSCIINISACRIIILTKQSQEHKTMRHTHSVFLTQHTHRGTLRQQRHPQRIIGKNAMLDKQEQFDKRIIRDINLCRQDIKHGKRVNLITIVLVRKTLKHIAERNQQRHQQSMLNATLADITNQQRAFLDVRIRRRGRATL
mmetsp:Transcript_27727/g.45720  ORF Transcript_27727/g.45720 Transcript_27727/m.45720 type:complete len:212 (-) Transcript_27727:229-864(-)